MSNKNKLRIGILTIHAAINYGSMLQAYALQHQLEAYAPEDSVELIDYLPACIMDQYSLNPLKNLHGVKNFLKYCVDFPSRRRRNRAFGSFAGDCFHTGAAYRTARQLEEHGDRWDVCVLGSDQVWNPEIVEDDPSFWLEFAKNSWRASFASSFGTTSIPDGYLARLVSALQGFGNIAVREPSAAQMLAGVEKPITVTCDPVFLLSAQEWEKLERKPREVPEHYIVLYTVQRNEKLEELVKQTAAHYGIPVVDLGIRGNPKGYFGIHSPDYGPREFLYLIRHADYMATNSFHGTAFATIFGKKCASVLHRSRGTRIRELAELADRSRYILPEDACAADMIRCLDEDREEDASRLNRRIEESKQYLKQMLDCARAAMPEKDK